MAITRGSQVFSRAGSQVFSSFHPEGIGSIFRVVLGSHEDSVEILAPDGKLLATIPMEDKTAMEERISQLELDIEMLQQQMEEMAAKLATQQPEYLYQQRMQQNLYDLNRQMARAQMASPHSSTSSDWEAVSSAALSSTLGSLGGIIRGK